MNVIYQKKICRDDLRRNPTFGYVFGDNLAMMGRGGQAYEMRGEPNAIGIPTKESPLEFMTDEDYLNNVVAIKDALDEMKEYEVIVFPIDGVGTGLAKLEEKAPETWKYLVSSLNSMGIENPCVVK